MFDSKRTKCKSIKQSRTNLYRDGVHGGAEPEKKIEERPLKLGEALNIAIQVADGLHEAHENDITYRDIKSSDALILINLKKINFAHQRV